MKGNLYTIFMKNGEEVIRKLHPDRTYQSPDHTEFSLHGRSLMFVRNVGHLMTNGAILDANGKEIYEGILRSEEHTSELQSRGHLVCRLLLEKKKQKTKV